MIKVFFLKNYLLFKKGTLNLIKRLGLRKFLFNTPSQFISIKKWIEQNTDLDGVQYYHLDDSVIINEPPPVIVSSPVTKRFSKYYHRFTPELFVAIIPDGRVMGESCNIIITPDYKVLADVSREFGAEGGKKIQDFSIFNSAKKMPLLKHISGNIAVISTCGSANFHHWNYDILPRFQLLKDAGVFNEIDYFLLDYKGLSFQKAGIDELQIDEKKIINTHGKKDFYIQAEKLFIPSLTEELGTINPRVVKFLRETFLHKDTLLPEKKNKTLYQ